MKQIRKLEDIDLGLPLAGNEGLDANDVSRVRAQYLFTQHQALIAQTQFADAKAAALMALLGLIALRGPIDIGGSGTAEWFRLVYLLSIACSILGCLMAIIPRYPSKATRNRIAEVDHWSWPALASDTVNKLGYGNYMQTSEVSQLVHSVASANSSIAHILLSKFQSLRVAFLFAVFVLILVGGHVTFGPALV